MVVAWRKYFVNLPMPSLAVSDHGTGQEVLGELAACLQFATFNCIADVVLKTVCIDQKHEYDVVRWEVGKREVDASEERFHKLGSESVDNRFLGNLAEARRQNTISKYICLQLRKLGLATEGLLVVYGFSLS
jgi:hypothetical protein